MECSFKAGIHYFCHDFLSIFSLGKLTWVAKSQSPSAYLSWQISYTILKCIMVTDFDCFSFRLWFYSFKQVCYFKPILEHLLFSFVWVCWDANPFKSVSVGSSVIWCMMPRFSSTVYKVSKCMMSNVLKSVQILNVGYFIIFYYVDYKNTLISMECVDVSHI